ncbi:MAG: hypothetical protein FJ122_17250 [Deltaproteobacteria bacterium]|nr:hypothetical protein [Deltaproteobacteria bacterium]
MHGRLISFLRREAIQSGLRIPIASIIAGISNGLINAVINEAVRNFTDEIAADQDPGFRKHFYHEALPGPRKQGTTIMAVTHDDRYFPVADTVVKMEFKAMVEGTAR